MKDNKRFTYGRTSAYNLNYHLIWRTKYRNKVLQGSIESDLKKCCMKLLKSMGSLSRIWGDEEKRMGNEARI